MEISLIDAAIKGFMNILQFKVFFAMMVGVSIGTFTAVAPQGLGIPLVYAIMLPVVIKWEPVTGMALLIGASSVSAICAAYLARAVRHSRRFGLPGNGAGRLSDGQAGRGQARPGGVFHGRRHGRADRDIHFGGGHTGGETFDLPDGVAGTVRGGALGS